MGGILPAELVNPTGSINQPLFTGKKRMAIGTDLNFHLFQNGAQFQLVAAGTGRCNLMKCRVDIFFHNRTPRRHTVARMPEKNFHT